MSSYQSRVSSWWLNLIEIRIDESNALLMPAERDDFISEGLNSFLFIIFCKRCQSNPIQCGKFCLSSGELFLASIGWAGGAAQARVGGAGYSADPLHCRHSPLKLASDWSTEAILASDWSLTDTPFLSDVSGGISRSVFYSPCWCCCCNSAKILLDPGIN